MVERPIKKSERQATAGSESTEVQEPVEARESKPKPTPRTDRGEKSEERNSERRGRSDDRDDRRGKGKGKGKGRDSHGDEPQSRVSAALMRGPKPTKPRTVEAPEIKAPEEAVSETEEATEIEAAPTETSD